MEERKVLHKIIANMPKRYVYGNPGDFARYKYLVRMTAVLSGKDSFLNKYIRDRNSIWVYPDDLGTAIFVDDGLEPKEINKLEEISALCPGTIYLPGKSREKIVTVFPVGEEVIDDIRLAEALFVESFPYGKKDFVEMVSWKNRELPFSVAKKVLFWDDGIKFGATDISDKEVASTEAANKLKQDMPAIEILREYAGVSGIRIDLKRQLKSKKRDITREKFDDFQKGFEREYENLKERYLCSEDQKGIISNTTYEEVSDYKRMENTDNVEKKILDNFLSQMEKHKKDFIIMLYYLYITYLDEIDVFSDEYFENRIITLIGEIRKTYHLGEKKNCPNSPLDYRTLCGQERYVIKLKLHVEHVLEEEWKKKSFEDIKIRLRKCEEKYDETY